MSVSIEGYTYLTFEVYCPMAHKFGTRLYYKTSKGSNKYKDGQPNLYHENQN